MTEVVYFNIILGVLKMGERHVNEPLDFVVGQSFHDARALSVRAQDSAAKFQD